MNALSIHQLTVFYNQRPILKEIDLEVEQGHLIGIVGPNGAGKSTFLKSILGLVPQSLGEISILGNSYLKNRKLVGYVPQRESVDWDFPTSALDVVKMGRYGHVGLFRRLKESDKKIALTALEKVGMLPFAERQISQLSGGQQQRVFLARALAQEAAVYFMDEPFSGVDAATEKAIISLLIELKELGKTVFVVHHDLHTVREYFDQVLLLNVKKIAFGRTEEVFTLNNLQLTYGEQLKLLPLFQ